MLPDWPERTVAVLSTTAGGLHAIPVSTAVRRDDQTITLALAHSRASLQALRDDPTAALTVIAGENLAFTAYGRARVVTDGLGSAPNVAAVVLDVEDVQDHYEPTYEIREGVRWEWVEEHARAKDRAIRAELAGVAL